MSAKRIFLGAYLLLVTWASLVSAEIYFKKGAPHVKLGTRGLISGAVKFSRDGRPYNSFTGIPYASVPERFQPSQLITDTWEGVKPTITTGNVCPQMPFGIGDGAKQGFGDEDCLNLNVYVPMNSTAKRGYPVMVWIHGGGFMFGDGITYGPKLFMDEDVILVTINYRLGVFGFLSTGDQVIPGSNGLKDQVVALKWVQENINAFGGDSGKVTIFGESAGGASVHFLTLSPTAKGLFHRAIAQSGSAFALWATQSNPKANAAKLATHLKCPTSAATPEEISSEEILTCFKGLTTEELNNAQFAYQESWPNNLHSFHFVPTVEQLQTATSTDIPFLTESPNSIYANGNYQAEVPLMIGATEDEGGVLFGGYVLQSEQYLNELETNWATLAPLAFVYGNHFSPEKQTIATEAIRKFYFGTQPISETRKGLVDLYSDELILYPVYKAAVETAKRGKRYPVYLYQYAYPGPFSIMGLSFQTTVEETKLVGHGDEIQHQFDFGKMGNMIAPDTPDEEFSKNLVKLWTSFAYQGEPKHNWGTATFRKWKEISKKELDGVYPFRWYRIDSNPAFVDDPYKERMAFWDQLMTDHYASQTQEAQVTSEPPTKTEL